jgi:hypothetical protein
MSFDGDGMAADARHIVEAPDFGRRRAVRGLERESGGRQQRS